MGSGFSATIVQVAVSVKRECQEAPAMAKCKTEPRGRPEVLRPESKKEVRRSHVTTLTLPTPTSQTDTVDAGRKAKVVKTDVAADKDKGTPALIKRRPKPNADAPKLPVALTNQEIVSKFAIQHEKSISQWLFRAPAVAYGGPGSKAFKYSREDRAGTEGQAKEEAVKWAQRMCRQYGCEMPAKLRR